METPKLVKFESINRCKVYPRHMRLINGGTYCSSGAREWFGRNNLSWNEFVFHGICESKLIATGDAMAIAVVEEARKEWAIKTKR